MSQNAIDIETEGKTNITSLFPGLIQRLEGGVEASLYAFGSIQTNVLSKVQRRLMLCHINYSVVAMFYK